MVLPKPENELLKRTPPQAHEINDGLLRLIGIPFFGISIPNFVGLFGPLGPADGYYWFGYIYFIAVAFSIWQGNRWLLFKQREHHNWFSNPVRKLINLVSANIFYTAPLTVMLIWGWYRISELPVDWNAIQICVLVNVICVLFVTHLYETVFLIKERQDDHLQFEQIQRARAQAELEVLKRQIDPHFMFNSLNTLSYLIESEPGKALLFNDKLADVYRYILSHKDQVLIPLQEEIDFLNNYFTLLRLRFGTGVELVFSDDELAGQYLIPPVSLQILMENAVKHNEFDERQPLQMRLEIQGEQVSFSNKQRLRSSLRPGAGIGLSNLNERCRLVTGREIEVDAGADLFSVKLPLLKTVV
jgi:sensor histidine kinase YesM